MDLRVRPLELDGLGSPSYRDAIKLDGLGSPSYNESFKLSASAP